MNLDNSMGFKSLMIKGLTKEQLAEIVKDTPEQIMHRINEFKNRLAELEKEEAAIAAMPKYSVEYLSANNKFLRKETELFNEFKKFQDSVEDIFGMPLSDLLEKLFPSTK